MSDQKSKPILVTLMLDYPFEYGGEEIRELEMRRLKGKHIKKLGKDPGMKEILELASVSSGQPPSFFDEMDAIDVMRVGEVIGDFLDNGQATGKN